MYLFIVFPALLIALFSDCTRETNKSSILAQADVTFGLEPLEIRLAQVYLVDFNTEEKNSIVI